MKVGIIGGSGYTGVELLRLLLPREDVELGFVSSRALAGSRVDAQFPSLRGFCELTFSDPSPEAGFAIDHFCYWTLRHAGSLIAALEGADAIAFTGGIGENAAAIRARLMQGLGWTGLRMDASANADGNRGPDRRRCAAADGDV